MAGLSRGSVSPVPRKSVKSVMAGEDPISVAAFDRVVADIEDGIRKMSAARGSHVRASQVERNLAPCMDDARDFLHSVLRVNDDRTLLKAIFGGECRRIVHLRALCYKLEFKVSTDESRKACIRECETVMHILKEKGYETTLLEAMTLEPDDAREPERVEARPVEEAMDKVKLAAGAHVAGFKLDQAGHAAEAVVTYNKAQKVIGVAITVIRAAVRFKELAKLDKAHLEQDATALASHRMEVARRISYLTSLKEDEVPMADTETVKPPKLKMLRDYRWIPKLLAWAGAFGATAGGAMLLGPVGGMVVGGVALAGATGTEFALQEEDNLLTKALSTPACQANCLCARQTRTVPAARARSPPERQATT